MPPRVPSSAFAGKIVVIGPAAPSLQDIHQTPVDPLMPGGEIQANAIATVLRGVPLRSIPARARRSFLIVLLALLVPAVSLGNKVWISMIRRGARRGRFRSRRAALVQPRLDRRFVYPLAAIGALDDRARSASHIVLTAFEREQVRNVFSPLRPGGGRQGGPKRTDADLRLGGEEVFGTVMFTDLRGFTSASEHLSAAQVIEMINDHLEQIVGAVLDARRHARLLHR